MRAIARALLIICLSFNAVPAHASPEVVVTPLSAKVLPTLKGKEGVMILVEYPPGASDPIHRHTNPLEWSAAPPGPYVVERARIIRRRIGQITPLLDCTR
jgi:hypothetical protein